MNDYIDDLADDANNSLNKIYAAASDLILIGSQISKTEIMAAFREIIAEKDFDDDMVAVEVLSWAYNKLASKLGM